MWLVDLNYICECDWLIELFNNKLFNNKLSNNKLLDNNLASKLVENLTFSNQSQPRKFLIIVVLWQKSHLSYWSHFKTQTSNLYEKKNALYYFQISLHSRDIQILLNMQISQVMTSYTQSNFDQIMMKKDVSVNLKQKCLILWSEIRPKVLHNTSLKSFVTMATYWVPDLPNVKDISGHLQLSVLIPLKRIHVLYLQTVVIIAKPSITI